MVFFVAVQSNNAPTEDEDDDESDLDGQESMDEFDVENNKGLEIRTTNPCKKTSDIFVNLIQNIKYIFHDKEMYKSGNCL